MSKKISIGIYNSLFAIAENGLQASWQDLGIKLDNKEIDEMLKDNEEMQQKAQNSVLPPSYFLYKKNANNIVDQILEELGVEVEED